MNPQWSESTAELAKASAIAKMLDTKERTVRDWVHRGIIPYVKLAPGPRAGLRFHIPTIKKWIAARAIKPLEAEV